MAATKPGTGDVLSVSFSSGAASFAGTVLDSRNYHLTGKHKGMCEPPAGLGTSVCVIDGRTAQPDAAAPLSPSEFLVFFPDDGEIWRLCAKKHRVRSSSHTDW
jgi:hypothetical protein